MNALSILKALKADPYHDEKGRFSSAPESVKNVIDSLNEKYPVNPENEKERLFLANGKRAGSFELDHREGRLRIRSIISDEPGSGVGSLILKRILTAADKEGVTTELTASSKGHQALSTDQLKAWYGKHGFVNEPGYDESLGYLIREPKTKKEDMPLVIKSDTPELQIVYGEVYAPDRLDAQDEFMTRDEIRKMAHEFIRSGKMGQIDVLHNNNIVQGCSVVESFIARDDDPTFIPHSWVVGVHVGDPDLWASIKKGDLNGFSMEALVQRDEQSRSIEIPSVVRGKTTKSEDHEHEFYVSYDNKGNFKGGITNTINAHYHTIIAGTHTEIAQGHSHRFSAVDNSLLVTQ